MLSHHFYTFYTVDIEDGVKILAVPIFDIKTTDLIELKLVCTVWDYLNAIGARWQWIVNVC